MKNYLLLFACAATFLLSACQREDDTDTQPATAELILKLSHQIGDQPLVYDQKTYTNALGQPYTVSEFRFFISNIRLRNRSTGATYREPDSYHLVTPDPNQEMTFEIVLSGIPPDEYDQVEFSIGIDNAHNYSLDQVGDLDPSSNMVWDWNTGYKFLLFEGRYKDRGLVYHIGSDFNYRTLHFNDRYVLRDRHTLDFGVDVGAIFGQPNPIDFEQNNVVMFQPISREVSQNYAKNMIRLLRFN
ncbi:MAG: MbnP family protein [Bernardetiaceae bacterium]